MGERSVERNGSRRSFKRLARRQVAALSLAGLVLLLVDRGRARGDRRPHPARRDRRLRQRDGGGALRRRPCARQAALGGGQPGREERLRRLAGSTPWRASTATRPPGRSPSPPGPPAASARRGRGPAPTAMGSASRTSVAVSPDGKSVYVASSGSDAVVRLNRNTTTGAITQPAGSRRLHQRDGGGALRRRPWARRRVRRWRSARTGRASTSPRADSDAVARLNRNTTTGAISQPAGTAGCISETGRGRAPTAMGSTARSRWRSARTGRASTSPRSPATPWRASTATRPPGRSPSPPGPPAASARRGRGPAPTAMGSTARARGGGQPGREERLRRLGDSDAVARLNRNTTTGAITQPAGTAGCVSETGAGPCADGHGLNGPRSVAVSPDGKSVYVASARQRRRGAPQPQHDHRGDHPARRDRRLRQRDGGGALRRRPWARRSRASVAVSPDGKSVYVASCAQRRRGALQPGALT